MADATVGSSPESIAYSRPIIPCRVGNSPTISVQRSALHSQAARLTV